MPKKIISSILLLFCICFSVNAQWKSAFPGGIYGQFCMADSLTYYIDESFNGLFGSNNNIKRSTDGGVSWRSLSRPSASIYNNIYSILFTSASNGYYSDHHANIFKTTDSAKTWVKMFLPDSIPKLTIYFPSDSFGYMAGHSGSIIKTIDAGQTWSILNSQYIGTIKTSYFLNDDTGFLAGDKIILRTTNGGVIWDTVLIDTNCNFNQIKFNKDQIGYAVGTFIYKSIDNGATWTKNHTPSKPLNSVDFINDSSIITVGELGYSIVSYNYGNNWSEMYSGTQFPFNSVQVFNPNRILASFCGRIVQYDSSYKPYANIAKDTNIIAGIYNSGNIYQSFNPRLIIPNINYFSNKNDLDINSDGINDIRLIKELNTANGCFGYRYKIESLNGSKIAVSRNAANRLKLFFSNETIDNHNHWTTGTTLLNSSESCNSCQYLYYQNNDVFVGIKVLVDGKYQYGWINISKTLSVSSFALNQECYSLDTLKVETCESYTWRNGINYTSSSNQIFDTLLSTTNSCSNITQLDLTIDTINSSIASSDSSLFSIDTANSFRWLDCSNNFSVIPNENSFNFIPSDTGTYCFEITSKSCIDTSNCILFQPTSIQKLDFINGISVYPTVVDFEVTFSSQQTLSYQLKIFNLNGQQVLSKNIIQQKNFNLQFLEPKGIYIIELSNGDSIRRIKFIKS